MRLGGNIYLYAVFFCYLDAVKLLRVIHQLRLDFRKAHNLHVGMADGAAGERAEVLEQHHCLVVTGVGHGEPVAQGEADKPVHVLRGVVGNVAFALVSFNQHQLVRGHHDIVLVFQQDDIALGGQDAGQVLYIAERTGALVGQARDGAGFLSAHGNVEVK